jgi:hypothetical protein
MQISISRAMTLGGSSRTNPNLVTDGGFDLGISQVTAKRGATLAWANSNSLRVTYGGTAEPQGWLALATVPGVAYLATVTVTQDTASAVLRAYRADQTSVLASATSQLTGTRTLAFTAQDTVTHLSLGANASVLNSTIFDNVSVRRS